MSKLEIKQGDVLYRSSTNTPIVATGAVRGSLFLGYPQCIERDILNGNIKPTWYVNKDWKRLTLHTSSIK